MTLLENRAEQMVVLKKKIKNLIIKKNNKVFGYILVLNTSKKNNTFYTELHS